MNHSENISADADVEYQVITFSGEPACNIWFFRTSDNLVFCVRFKDITVEEKREGNSQIPIHIDYDTNILETPAGFSVAMCNGIIQNIVQSHCQERILAELRKEEDKISSHYQSAYYDESYVSDNEQQYNDEDYIKKELNS